MPVVVAGVAAQHALEVGFVHDQQVVEALRSHRAHEPFGKGVRVRGSKGRPEDLGAFGVGAKSVIHVTRPGDIR